ncbi:MAG: hypothetical protein HC906_12760 [Bacteroidales bacterium]|nr:hypothetical protein [Bacteroidales bacterium]
MKEKKNLMQGKYLLVDFNNDPEFKDIPHLFLEKGNKFQEWILPNEVPKNKGDKVKLIRTKNKIDSQKIYDHINKEPKNAGNSLKSKSKSELMELAKNKNIKGRSKMKKDELVEELAGK